MHWTWLTTKLCFTVIIDSWGRALYLCRKSLCDLGLTALLLLGLMYGKLNHYVISNVIMTYELTSKLKMVPDSYFASTCVDICLPHSKHTWSLLYSSPISICNCNCKMAVTLLLKYTNRTRVTVLHHWSYRVLNNIWKESQVLTWAVVGHSQGDHYLSPAVLLPQIWPYSPAITESG